MVVEVAAAALNFPDVLLVADRYQLHVPVPFTPGSEFAGTVASVGPGVDTLAVGDRVMGATLIGAFAERLAVPAAVLRKVPDGVDLGAAAAFGVAHRTAYHALRSVARMQAGDWVVVLGAGRRGGAGHRRAGPGPRGAGPGRGVGPRRSWPWPRRRGPRRWSTTRPRT